jgi:hypothetical protein
MPEFGIPYLHFDFVVTTRLRELGHFTTADGFGGRFENILPHSKPAEVRANNNKTILSNYFIFEIYKKIILKIANLPPRAHVLGLRLAIKERKREKLASC